MRISRVLESARDLEWEKREREREREREKEKRKRRVAIDGTGWRVC